MCYGEIERENERVIVKEKRQRRERERERKREKFLTHRLSLESKAFLMYMFFAITLPCAGVLVSSSSGYLWFCFVSCVLARVRFPVFVDSMLANCGWFSFAANFFESMHLISETSIQLAANSEHGGDQNSKWMQYATTIFFKITCVRVVVHYHLFCFSLVLFSELICLIYLVLLCVTVRKQIMTTQFRMQPFGCGHKPLRQVMADHRGSPPSFPPSRVGDHSMKQVSEQ